MKRKALKDEVHKLQGQKILVTGASGFIGSHLCRRLYREDIEVHAVTRRKPPNDKSPITWWQGDLAEIETVRNLLRGIRPGVIFHLASHVVGAREVDQVLPTFHCNLMSTVNLLTVAEQIGCRIVITGSLEEPEPDDHEAIPCSPYAAAKWAGSAYARMFHALYHLPVVILRVFMVYGPGERHLQKLVPHVILTLLRGESPKLSSGKREVDWVYVEDVVEGILAAGQAVDVEGKTIDIGSGDLVPIRAVVNHLNRMINPRIKPLFSALPDRPFEQVRVADITKSYAMIGWKPKTALEEGLRRTVQWFKQRNDILAHPSRSHIR